MICNSPTLLAFIVCLVSLCFGRAAHAVEVPKHRSARDVGVVEFDAHELEVGASQATRDVAAAIELRTKSADDSTTVRTPFIPIEPGHTYRVQAILNVVAADPDTSICIWNREYPEPLGRPFTPYPRTRVSGRAVKPHQMGIWTIRSVTFEARPKAAKLQVSVVVSGAAAIVRLKKVRVLDLTQLKAVGRGASTPALAQLRKQARTRRPLLDRTLVFSRSQMKYGLERNYGRQWIDRPLLVDRALRVPRKFVTPYPSYARILEVVKLYGLDGLAFFPETKDRMGMFELTDRANVEGVRLLPEFIPTKNLEGKLQLLEAALRSKSALRIEGKILISSYVAGALTPGEWKTILDALRQRFGDCFLFLPALTEPVRFKNDYHDGIPIAEEDIAQSKAYLRSYLDVCDGIYFNYAAALKRKDRTFDDAFYRDVFIPVFKSVLAEPQYHAKYFGLSAYHSHYNADLSLGLQEDGTKTLRRSFEAAMDARPDIIILPEWDEVNENTCFRPTVYNSFTTQRILRYYMSQIRGTPATPNPSDDSALPNLALSYRKLLTVGERLELELLNIPDGTPAQTYRAHLRLFDLNGHCVREFEPATFRSDELKDRTFVVPSEELADCAALIPTLSIDGYGDGERMVFDRGFHHIQLRPTWNWDYKWVKQPLRDLIRPQSTSFKFTKASTGADGQVLTVSGTFACAEDIALAEVLEDDGVVYAVDPSNEFFRDSDDMVRLWIELRSLRQQKLTGNVMVRGASCTWRFHNVILHQPEPSRNASGSRVELKTPASCHLRWLYAVIPRAAADSATLLFDFDTFRTEVPVAQILRNGIYSETHADGLTVTVVDYWKQPDMPMHLNRKEVAFTAQVKPELPTSQFHMRITTTSGKTFRTAPLLVPTPERGASVELPVYSDNSGTQVVKTVRKMRVPDCTFEFVRDYGTIFHTPAGRPFWAHLGGYADTSSGRGGNGAGASATLFRFGTQNYPKDARITAPAWRDVDGRLCLEFDGVGNYILFPRETLPRHGPFSLSFEILPHTIGKPQLLFAHRTTRVSSLMLYLAPGGALRGTFAAQGHKHRTFDSNLRVKVGEWSMVEAIYDFETLRFRVNGREQSFPCHGVGLNIGLCVFGGYGKTSKHEDAPGNAWWFKGLLRSFRIRHDAGFAPHP
ncbi:MAG: hypothetical protein KAI66_00220 [Lentisphaeria bacterium]|nr:hypothetical protein [Lentisphaeria bacterium]